MHTCSSLTDHPTSPPQVLVNSLRHESLNVRHAALGELRAFLGQHRAYVAGLVADGAGGTQRHREQARLVWWLCAVVRYASRPAARLGLHAAICFAAGLRPCLACVLIRVVWVRVRLPPLRPT